MPSAAGPLAVGVDVASVSRVVGAANGRPRLRERAYTAAEAADCAERPRRWASRWAAKEAVRKLCGSLGISPLPAFASVEVVYDRDGAPRVRSHDPRVPPVSLSVSHEGDSVVAVVVSSGGDPLGRTPYVVVPARLRLPGRPDDAHKGTFGTVVVLGGAHGFSGAPYLAAMGAARAGAGRIRLCVPQSLHAVVAVKCDEVMAHPLPDSGSGVVGDDSVEALRDRHLEVADVLVVGPGIGQAERTAAAVAGLLESAPCPLVVDADGLNVAAARGVDWRRCGQPVVLTPHPTEMARLTGATTAAVQADRVGAARRYAAERGAVVVLKGSETVVAAPDGRLHHDRNRVVALASGGTGDVLAGVLGAFVAGGLDPFDAAVAAVTVHVEAGLAVQAVRGRAGALASDVLDALPAAQERLRRAIEARDEGAG